MSTKFDYKAELYYNPIFDYLKYYKEEKFTDCQVVFTNTNKPPIKAHAIVLANSSRQFRQVMQSIGTTSFEIYENPMDLFPKVLEFLYCGKLEYTNDQVVALLHIAKRYNIPSLRDRMISHLTNNVNHDNIYKFADMCYQYELEEVLSEDLVPLFVANFDRLSIQNLTITLDVITFCRILEKLKDSSPTQYNPDQLIRLLDEFVGDFECDEEEKQACLNLFNTGLSTTRNLLRAKRYSWLPDSFYLSK